jgi:hypothetical protein
MQLDAYELGQLDAAMGPRDEPDRDIEFVDSTKSPVGLGEPGTTVILAQIAEAVFVVRLGRFRWKRLQ